MGVHVLRQGRPGVVEYGELPPDLEAKLAPNGTLLFSDAYVGMFIVNCALIQRLVGD